MKQEKVQCKIPFSRFCNYKSLSDAEVNGDKSLADKKTTKNRCLKYTYFHIVLSLISSAVTETIVVVCSLSILLTKLIRR